MRKPEKTFPKTKPEGKKCGQEIWLGTKAQAQSPSYGTLQCDRELTAPKKIKSNNDKREVGSEA